MIATKSDLDVRLLQERVKYLESVVGILQPELESRLNGVDVVVLPERSPVTNAPPPAVEAPRLAALPKPKRSSEPVARRAYVGKSRADQIADVLREANGETIPTGDLCRRIYHADSPTHRQALSNATKALRDAGIVETRRGGFQQDGGYRWVTETPAERQRTASPRDTVTPRAANGGAVADRVAADSGATDWRKDPDLCWHVAGYCPEYARSEFCGHCTDQDGGVACQKRHRKPDPNERVQP